MGLDRFEHPTTPGRWWRRQAPFVATGKPDAWAELRRMTPEWMVRHHGDAVFNVYASGVEQHGVQARTVTMRQFVHHLRNPPADAPRWYLGEHYGLVLQMGLLPRLRAYAEPLVPRVSFLRHAALWLGPDGSRTGLHSDPDGVNVLCVVFGHKRFHLYAPDQEPYMAVGSRYDGGARSSTVDLWDPHLEQRFPQWRHARGVTVDLGPGDMLYVPRHWWHAVENQSVTVALSYRVETPLTAALNLPVAARRVLHQWGLYRRGDCTCHVTQR